MENIYAAMLLHKAGKAIDEASVTKVLEAAGITVDAVQVKALVASLSEVNIDEAIKAAPTMMAAAPAQSNWSFVLSIPRQAECMMKTLDRQLYRIKGWHSIPQSLCSSCVPCLDLRSTIHSSQGTIINRGVSE
jgi:hypothetical protein